MNSSSNNKIAIWQQNPHISKGRVTVIGSRIERRFLRFMRETYGVFLVQNWYPWIPLENIEQA